MAVSRVLNSIATKLCSTRVRWFSDNQNVIRILHVGSRKPNLQEQALKVFEMCIIHQIRLEPEWVPRAQNELADFISELSIMMTGRSVQSCFIIWNKHGVHLL